MGAGALAALGSGWLFDRTRGRVLLGLPLLVAAVPVLAFAGSPPIAIAGVLLWGVAAAVLDSTIKGAGGRPSPGLETRHRVRCVRRNSRRSRHRRQRHGRRTVLAFTPHTACGHHRQSNRGPGTADRNLATASTNPHSGILRRSMTGNAFGYQCDR